ncbi:hypothetical protein OG625_17635 [Streptomyces sp. NBC_01351]|uniref:hypothetical protein n=1 Tax=Streptomyces sp. NBC_01351 TaxID=2903833 RepID=UPI002E37650D|nr:hypothetical protein [Streptomyces sp. NBC_01351]
MTEQNTTGAAPEPVDTVKAPAPQDAVPAQAQSPETLAAPAPQDAVPAQAQAPAATDTLAAFAAPQAPGAPGAADAPQGTPAPKDRRKLFAFLRWTAAVTVFAVAGAGVAYGLMRPERTDVPGLSTKDDGRWVFPALAKPVLPPGAAQPFAEDNEDGIHYAAAAELLLPAPKGSTQDPALKLEKDSVVSPDTFLEEYESTARAKMKQAFVDDGLRQIVARGWVTPDGTRTRIYLLRFHASGFTDLFEGCGANMNVNGVNRIEGDDTWGKAKTSQPAPDLGDVSLFAEAKPVGDEQVKAGCIQAGDLQAVIFQTRKGEVATVPFHQTVILQNQLLH